MSAEHRRPVVAFVMLAFVTVAVIGIQRAEAQAGRFVAAMVGATVQVQGTLPAASDASREATLERAAELGPAFAAVAGASLPRLGSESAEAATQTLAGISGSDSDAVGEAAVAETATVDTAVAVTPVVAGEDRQAPSAGAGHGVGKVDRAVAKAVRRAARTEAKADRRAARAAAKVQRQLYRPAAVAGREVARMDRPAAPTQAKADRRAARVAAKAERSVDRAEAQVAGATVRAEAKRERRTERAAVRAEREVAKLTATAGFLTVAPATARSLHADAHGRR